MFLGFAMCATIAFAQTNLSRNAMNVGNEKIKLSELQKQAPVDYKASIFTKENGLDTLTTYTFANASDYTIGNIAASDVIKVKNASGTYVDSTFGNTGKHSVSAEWATWRRYNSTTDFYNNMNADYGTTSNRAFIISRMDTTYNPGVADDGFMLLFYSGASYVGKVNSYFTLPTYTRTTANRMVVVGFTQAYAKYYDQCFIDYKIGNDWYIREVNVSGIDAEVNYASAAKMRVTMPNNLASQSDITLRFRAFSSMRGSAYGYFWAVDNVAIINNSNTKSWTFNNATALDGFYGTMPQGMTIPMTYGVNVRNTNVDDLAGAKISILASSDNYNSPIASTPVTVPAGNIEQDYLLLINERGFYDEEASLTSGYQSWLGSFANYGNTTGNLGTGFQGRSLPTGILGPNFFTIKASESTNNENLTRTFDTILYTVSDYDESTNSSLPSGYVWAHDNGLIPSGSAFQYAYVVINNQGYITSADEDEHTSVRGYRVHTRYVTGNTIPTDQSGQPWRMQGVEFIAATDRPDSVMLGAMIYPLVYEEVYTDDGYLNFVEVPTGVTNSVEVTVDDINTNLYNDNGFMLPSDNYKSVKVRFLNQPELKPNTAYRFGYYLNSDARFCVAKVKNQYWDTDSTAAYYSSNPTTAPYASQFSPATYLDVIVIDPEYTDEDNNPGQITAWNIDEYPMIRPIIGDEIPVERRPITIDCTTPHNPDGTGFYVPYGAENVCDNDIMVAVGASIDLNVMPSTDHSVIDSIFLTEIDAEGHENRYLLTVYDAEDNPEGQLVARDASVYDDDEHLLLQRNYYTLYLEEIPSGISFVITAYTHYEDFLEVGIDPVASDVHMTLAPNPTTSSVKLNLNGVSGMVNCNIIDMSGRVVYNANINAEAETTINVSNMPAGAYFVRVTNDTFSKIEKLIIK